MSTITLKGKIRFDPTNKTNKHKLQSSWKVIAMVMLEGDICELYSWFINKRYNSELVKPLRGPHVSFINDRMSDVKGNSDSERTANWESLKKKWDGKEVEIHIDPDARTDGKHWWLNIPEEERGFLQSIRSEIGLGRPYYGMHMSIGYYGMGYEDYGKMIHDSVTLNYQSASEKLINKLIDKGILHVKDGEFISHQKQLKLNRKHFIL